VYKIVDQEMREKDEAERKGKRYEGKVSSKVYWGEEARLPHIFFSNFCPI